MRSRLCNAHVDVCVNDCRVKRHLTASAGPDAYSRGSVPMDEVKHGDKKARRERSTAARDWIAAIASRFTLPTN